VPFSTVANFVTLISFGVIAFYIFKEPVTLNEKDAFGTLKGELFLFRKFNIIAYELVGGAKMKKVDISKK
jgi:solute carrier family 36 (proton-coupled amino acid transporter)